MVTIILAAPGVPAVLLLAAQVQQSNSLEVTLLLFGGVLLGALLVLLLNEYRARQRAPKPAQGRRQTTTRKLPKGRIVYQDADGTAAPLFSKKYPLSGKPDYVILSPEDLPIPVELKLSIDAREPQQNHVMQLAAYFVILEDLYDQPPQYGVLRYASHEFSIQYTESLKRKVVQRLMEMERCDEHHPPLITSQLASKCRACPFQPICPIGLKKM